MPGIIRICTATDVCEADDDRIAQAVLQTDTGVFAVLNKGKAAGMNMKLPDMNREGLVDIHCHILPGIDDGSRTPEESLELVRQSYEQGFRTFVATSHYARRHDNPDIEGLVGMLQEAVLREHPDVKIYPGHETFWHEELPARIRNGQARRLAGSSYVLCEFQISAGYNDIVRGLRGISETGCTPVLAHFERYASLREGSRVEEIKRYGVIMQMNYEVLHGGGLFNANERWCRQQVLKGITDVLGTDMHRTDFRPPSTQGAVKWLKSKLSYDHFDVLTRRNALHIIRNEELE